jgi:hypothetical protein
MWRRVKIELTDVSEERFASIFRVENKNKSASEPGRVSRRFILVFYLEDGGYTSVNTISTRRHIPVDGILYRNVVYEVSRLSEIFFSSSLKSSMTDFGCSFWCSQTKCPSLLPVGPRTVSSSRAYILRLQTLTTFTFGRWHKPVYFPLVLPSFRNDGELLFKFILWSVDSADERKI